VLPKQYNHALLRSRDAVNYGGFGPMEIAVQDS